MASSFINNLSNTYRQSPSLQNQFATEQDYLDLFDTNRTTPAMAQAYVPTNDTTGIESIVNTTPTIVNQRGGGADTDPTGPTTGFSSQGAPYGNAKGGIHDSSGTGIAGTGITGQGLMAALSFAMNPVGFFVGRLAKKAYKEYKEKKEKERIQKEKERIEAEKAAANAYEYAGRSNQYGTHYSTISKNKAASNREGQRGGSSGFSSAERGGALHGARGGFVPTGLSRGSYFNGGIVSLRRR